MFSRPIHVAACIRTSFLFFFFFLELRSFLRQSNSPLYGHTTCFFSICPLMDIWVISTFWSLPWMVLCDFTYKFLGRSVFSFLLGHSPGSSDDYASHFRNHLPAFWSSCCLIHYSQLWASVSISPLSCQHLLLYVSFIVAILVCVKWVFLVASIYISLKANDVEHAFTNVLATCLSSLEKCLFRSFA